MADQETFSIGAWMTEGVSQASFREYMEFTDQHGRTWGAPIEVRSRHACGPYEPQFELPHPIFMPPQRFINPHPSSYGRVVIDYEGWMSQVEELWADHSNFMIRLALEMYPDQDTHKVLEDPPKALLHQLGGTPQIRKEVVMALMAGDPWALGEDGAEEPARAQEYLPKPKPFVKPLDGSEYVATRNPFADDYDPNDTPQAHQEVLDRAAKGFEELELSGVSLE